MLPIETIIAQGESETLEFKPSFNQDVIETAAALANTRGGRILIGVSNTGAPAGALFSQEALRDAVNRISNATEPSVIPDTEKVSLDGGDVLVLTVPEYPLKPVAVRGRCFKRSGSTTRQMIPAEIAEVHLQCTGQSPDTLPVDGKTVADLNLELVRLYMTRAKNSGRRSFSENDDPLAVLQKLELVRNGREVTRAAVFLFGKNPQSPFSQAVVHAGRVRGATEIMDDRFIRGSIIEQVEESLDFIKKHMNVKSVISGKSRRDDVWDYPLTALREGLTNAICHRDYGDLADIQIKIYDHSLQIWSPGFLPFGMTVEELLRPNHSSKPRNRLIAQAFYDMGMIEQYGSGIKRVIDACLEAGLPEPEFENFSGGFQIVFKPTAQATAQDEGTDGEQVGEQASEQVGEQVGLALKSLKHGEKTKAELLGDMGLANAYLNYKRHVVSLLELGLIEMTIPDKPNSRLQKYRLTEKGKLFLKGTEN
jgi:ATP-dependent DNA helicase RecG